MPFGIQRLNVRRRSPNDRITFIKALDGEDSAVAQDFLERIAAIVYPIMRDNGLGVMSLDEFPTNREFWGRNFNGGECIQLVLKHPGTGEWLPFRFVQGVMIHELAHIKQMNHSSAFWAVNRRFSSELKVLHAKRYTGEGFWSAGRTLLSDRYTQDRPLAESEMPRSLCGGTYRSRTRLRKAPDDHSPAVKKPRLSRSERQKRRIARTFRDGEGSKVGVDDAARSALEKGKKTKSAPRVAQSARGRELRAAAALKRIETKKAESRKPEEEEEQEEGGDTGDESTGDDTDYEDDGGKAVDVGNGRYLIPVSEKEDGDREYDFMRGELLDLADACGRGVGREKDGESRAGGEPSSERKGGDLSVISETRAHRIFPVDCKETGSPSDPEERTRAPAPPPAPAPAAETDREVPPGHETRDPPLSGDRHISTTPSTGKEPEGHLPHLECTACSFANNRDAVLCLTCANVLEPGKMKSAWRCSCYGDDLRYLNAGDAGVCGICGQRKNQSRRR